MTSRQYDVGASKVFDTERKCAGTIGTVLVPWAGNFQWVSVCACVIVLYLIFLVFICHACPAAFYAK